MATSAGKVLIMPKGAWASSVTYLYLDLVTHNSTKWLCVAQSCTGIEPSAQQSAYWFQWDDANIGGSPVTFSTAASRADLSSGDTVSTLFGKTKKWLTDLQDIAFSGDFGDLSNVPTASTTDLGMVKVDGTTITISNGVISGADPNVEAEDVDYDNQTSQLLATDVQGAIDELKTMIGTGSADDISYDNTSSGLTATNVQSAIDEVAERGDIMTATLLTGATTVTFTDSRIGADSAFTFYTSSYGLAPSSVAVSGTSITLTFEAQASDIVVGCSVIN